MAASVSNVDILLSLRDGFERFATRTDEIGQVLEIELRHLLEDWDERVQKARHQERDCQNDLSDAERDLRWCIGLGDLENPPNCSYEQERVAKAQRSLAEAQAHVHLVSRSAREIQMACEAFQKHGRNLRQMATQTAPNAASRMNALLRDLEHHAFITPAKEVSHVPTSSGFLGVPFHEQAFDSPDETSAATPQSPLSPSVRALAALLRGQAMPTAPPDTTQIELAVQQLRFIAQIAPDVWPTLLQSQRVTALCSVERIMAELQGRPTAPVIIASDTHNSYDPQAGYISLNQDFIEGANSREIIEAIIHHGRHAYQAHAMRHPTFHADANEVGRWRINNSYYLHAAVWGDESYRNQPLEHDAFTYTEAIIAQLYRDAQ